MARVATLSILLLALGAAVYWWPRGDAGHAPATPATPQAPTAPAPAPAPAKAEVTAAKPPAPAAAAPDRSRQLELPDGTFVDALNGATGCAPLSQFWSAQRPWSPIVGIEKGKDIDWYRHADGSYSTTQMVWRQDLGRHDAMTRVAHPGPDAPAVGGAAR
jgi:hypothetical protein